MAHAITRIMGGGREMAPESRTPRGRGQRRQEGAVSKGEESISNALGMLSELKERNIRFQKERNM